MSTAEIAKGLVELCRQNKNIEAIDKYYADNIVSVESVGSPTMPAEMKGIQAVKGKNKWWLDNHEVHSAEANGPFVSDNKFAVEFKYEVTPKASGKRLHMHEMGLYTVEGDKIVHEHFFYNAGG